MHGSAPGPADIRVARLAGNIGAEISGVDAGAPLGDDVIERLRRELLTHKVIFLRDQRLDYEKQVRFGQRLGTLTYGHPIYPPPETQPYLREIDSSQDTRANHWHTDLTFVDRPPAIALLYAVVIPPVGGDTIWANTVTAYQSIPAELRDYLDRLRIVHSNDSDYTDSTVTARHDYVATVYEADHPAVTVHPETGERAILAGGFARHVVGLSPESSRSVLRILHDYITAPEQTARWHWRVGDLAIWDNRATQHYAIYDYGTHHRRCERVTVAGEVPVGVDGRLSVMVRGDASAYARAY
jgi:taurine dioxygenase